MTASQSHCKSVRRVRRLSTGHDTARPDIRQLRQIAGQLMKSLNTRCSSVGRRTIEQPMASPDANQPARLRQSP
jgi:hypothetical protein